MSLSEIVFVIFVALVSLTIAVRTAIPFTGNLDLLFAWLAAEYEVTS